MAEDKGSFWPWKYHTQDDPCRYHDHRHSYQRDEYYECENSEELNLTGVEPWDQPPEWMKTIHWNVFDEY